jgi:putative ABC transport system permease protein
MRSLFALIRTVSIRYLAKRWDRAALIVASIALGVAMLVSTQLLNRCLEAAAMESVNPGSEPADLAVTSNRRVRLDLLPALRAIPGVASAQPFILERVVLPDQGNRKVVLIGLDLVDLSRQHADGRLSKNPFGAEPKQGANLPAMLLGGVIVAEDLAKDIKAGESLRPFAIRAGGRRHMLHPCGEVVLQGAAAKLGGFLLVMDVRFAAQALNQDGICERIDLYLGPGADREAVKAAAQAAVGSQALVSAPEATGQGTREIVGGIRVVFALCGVGAMVVGLFLVYNALAVSVAERRHDIGVLRSMGATRPQIAGLFTGESMVLGLIGAVLGVPLGYGLAKLTFYLVRLEMEQLFLTGNQPLDLTWGTVLLAVGSGVATAWLAALVPAMQAASDEPADAVRRAPSSAGRFYRHLQVLASVAMIGTGFSFVLIRDHLPRRVGGFGGMALLLIGMLLAVPFLVGVIAGLIQPFTRRFFGIEARLAADNLLRAPGRTGVVVGALAAGVALMFQIAGIGKSNEEPVLEWLDRVVSADFIVICGDPKSTSSLLPMQPEVADKLKALPGVEATMPVRYTQPEFNGRQVFVTALDAQAYHDTNRNASRLPQLELFPKLTEPNTCLVSENFAALNKVDVGNTIELQGPDGPVSLRILGIVPEYSWPRGTILIDRAFYARAFHDPLIDSIHVFLRRDTVVADRERVKKFTDSEALVILTPEDFNGILTNFIRRLYALAYMQQIAVGIVAALGVVMALLISILQRRRELGLLRAVGATQGQVLYTVLAEATFMGVLGTILGVLAGMPLEWYLLRVVIYEESGYVFPVTFPWKETLALAGLAIGTATFAGLLPALHAVRLRIAEAIAYE